MVIRWSSGGHLVVIWSSSGHLVIQWPSGHMVVIWSSSGHLVIQWSFCHPVVIVVIPWTMTDVHVKNLLDLSTEKREKIRNRNSSTVAVLDRSRETLAIVVHKYVIF